MREQQDTVVTLEETAVQESTARLRGRLLRPGAADYEQVRHVYNAMIDKRPAAIARCVDVADVMAAVNFARDQGLTLTARGGEHNGPGLGTCDDGLVIDLSGKRGIRVDPSTRTAHVEGGCTWGEVDHATHPFGLATPSGFVSTTSVGGLTLGGGICYLSRSLGLTIDNLLGVDMVLADGSFISASASEHPDPFWALHGGGNIGVVTSFLFQAHPVHTLYAGPMLWELSQAPELMRWYQEFIKEAPDDINGFFAFLIVPPGPPFPEQLHNKNMCGIVWGYTGPMELAEATFKPIREKFPLALDFVGPIPHPALQSMFDPLYAPKSGTSTASACGPIPPGQRNAASPKSTAIRPRRASTHQLSIKVAHWSGAGQTACAAGS